MPKLRWSKENLEALRGYCGDTPLTALMFGKRYVGKLCYSHLRPHYSGHLLTKRDESNGSCSRCIGTFAVPSDAMVALAKKVQQEILTSVKCRSCGYVELPWERNGEVTPDICGRCDFWMKLTEKYRTRNDSFVCNGTHYTIGQEFPRDARGFRGFGGAPHLILFDDGRQIFSTNVWTQGDVPKSLRYLARDNAEFVCDSDDEKIARELPPCNCGALPFPHTCWPNRKWRFPVVAP